MTENHRITLLAIACVAATLATFSTACVRRFRLWVNGRNSVLAYAGNHNVQVEAMRLTKQALLAYGTVIVEVQNVLVILVVVSILMAITSVSSIWHQVRLSRMMEQYHL